MNAMNALKESAENKDTDVVVQLVAFRLGAETYGVDIARVHTVITPHDITPIPNALPFVEGVMNLRGRIVPVISLRKRFGMAESENHAAHGPAQDYRIMIVEEAGEHAGLIVDAVSEVLRLPSSALAPPAALTMAGAAEAACITDIGRTKSENGDERLILVLNIAAILAPCQEMTLRAAA